MKLVTVSNGNETKLKRGDIGSFQKNGVLTFYRRKKTYVPVSPEELCFVDGDGIHSEDFHVGSSLKEMNVRIFELFKALKGSKLDVNKNREIYNLAFTLFEGTKKHDLCNIFELIKVATGLKYKVLYKVPDYIRVKLV